MHDGDGISAQCAVDLMLAYNELNFAIPDYFPASVLGNGQILIAGIYSIPSTASLNLDLILDAQNNPNAIFIFKIEGAFSSAANSQVKLVNGALACNVFWKIDGAVLISDYYQFKGTIICNNGAVDLLTGVQLEGRAMTTTGALSTAAITSIMTGGCPKLKINQINSNEKIAVFYPNPFDHVVNIILNDATYLDNAQLNVYDVYGRMVFNKTINELNMELNMSELSIGVYYYKINSANKTIQSGGLIAK